MITCTFENGGIAHLRHVVVHAIAQKDGKLLLVKRATGLLEGGKWSLPSGFLDRGETAGEGTLRELKEETGWEGTVTSLFYINTNPSRPHEDRQNVALYFLVDVTVQRGTPDSENSTVSWIPFGELPEADAMAFDHGDAVQKYMDYRRKPFALPLSFV